MLANRQLDGCKEIGKGINPEAKIRLCYTEFK